MYKLNHDYKTLGNSELNTIYDNFLEQLQKDRKLWDFFGKVSYKCDIRRYMRNLIIGNHFIEKKSFASPGSLDIEYIRLCQLKSKYGSNFRDLKSKSRSEFLEDISQLIRNNHRVKNIIPGISALISPCSNNLRIGEYKLLVQKTFEDFDYFQSGLQKLIETKKRDGSPSYKSLYAEHRDTLRKIIINETNCRVCIYCNSHEFHRKNGILTLKDIDLDHCFNLSDFPLYQVSLWNLIPSCPMCNRNYKGRLVGTLNPVSNDIGKLFYFDVKLDSYDALIFDNPIQNVGIKYKEDLDLKNDLLDAHFDALQLRDRYNSDEVYYLLSDMWSSAYKNRESVLRLYNTLQSSKPELFNLIFKLDFDNEFVQLNYNLSRFSKIKIDFINQISFLESLDSSGENSNFLKKLYFEKFLNLLNSYYAR